MKYIPLRDISGRPEKPAIGFADVVSVLAVAVVLIGLAALL